MVRETLDFQPLQFAWILLEESLNPRMACTPNAPMKLGHFMELWHLVLLIKHMDQLQVWRQVHQLIILLLSLIMTMKPRLISFKTLKIS